MKTKLTKLPIILRHVVAHRLRQPCARRRCTLCICRQLHVAHFAVELEDDRVLGCTRREGALHDGGNTFSAKSGFPERDCVGERDKLVRLKRTDIRRTGGLDDAVISHRLVRIERKLAIHEGEGERRKAARGKTL